MSLDLDTPTVYVLVAALGWFIYQKVLHSTHHSILGHFHTSSKNTTVTSILALANHKHLKIQRVTPSTAASVHRELSSNGGRELIRLVQSRLTPLFVYDFFSCVAGRHLKGSSLIRGRIPMKDEYLPGGNFWWSGIQIHVVRNSKVKIGGKGSIQGLYVFHDAYLSSYPGPNTYYHDVDPVLSKRKTTQRHQNVVNVGVEFNDRHALSGVGRGSKKWCDIPILAGPGIGRLVLAHCIHTRCHVTEEVEEEKQGEEEEEEEEEEKEEEEEGVEKEEEEEEETQPVKFFVSVAGGRRNTRMYSLLVRFGFQRLHMFHPVTRDPWLDEAGDELFVLSRQGDIGGEDAAALLSVNPKGPHKKSPMSKKKKNVHQRSKSKSRKHR